MLAAVHISAILQSLVLIGVVASCTSILVYQIITGVPPQSSSMLEALDVVELLQQAGLREGAIIYELGSGWGSLVVALARAFPNAQIRGIEVSPLPYFVSLLRSRNLANVRIRRANFCDCDFRDAQAVTCYLMIKSMPKVAALLDGQLRHGTPVIALSFWFRGRKTSASRSSSGVLGSVALYYWPA